MTLMDGEPVIRVARAIVVYTGEHRELHGAVELWPVAEFLRELFAGHVF